VSPTKTLYASQRCSTTRSFTGPANSAIAIAAALTTASNNSNGARRKRRRVTAATASMNSL